MTIPFADRYNVPVVITGFEPVDLLTGILNACRASSLARRRSSTAMSGRRLTAIPHARRIVGDVYEICDRLARAGSDSARGLEAAVAEFDAADGPRANADRGAAPPQRRSAHRPHCPTDRERFSRECL